MPVSISIGFVVRNATTGEMLAECHDGPVGFVRTAFSPNISRSQGDALRIVARLGHHMHSLWLGTYDQETPEDLRARYEEEHVAWHAFLEGAEVVELFVVK